MDPFDEVICWLAAERDAYQIEKFDYAAEKTKPTAYWIQQFDSYIQRLPVFDGQSPDLYAQAALKLAATAVALCEHIAEDRPLPRPGVSSGLVLDWTKDT